MFRHPFPTEKNQSAIPLHLTIISHFWEGTVEEEIREPWRRKLRNYVDDYISLFPDFICKSSVLVISEKEPT